MRPSMYQKSFGDLDDPPLVAGSVFGIRTYSLEKPIFENMFLMKPFQSWTLRGSMVSWKTSTMEASCNPWWIPPVAGNSISYSFGMAYESDQRPCRGDVPNENCTCGIYGYWKVPNPLEDTMTVFAVVEASGKVILGTKGFRAQRVRIRSLYIDRLNPESVNESIKRRNIESKLSIRYKVPVYSTIDKMLYDFPLTQEYLNG